MQLGNSEDKKIFWAHSPPQGEVDNVIAAFRFVRIKKGSSALKDRPRGPKRGLSEVGQFISADNARPIMCWKRIQQCARSRK